MERTTTINLNRQLLEQPFDPAQIKQRQGRGGLLLDYIEGHAIIQRLNDAFDGCWSFQVREWRMTDTDIIVLGRLEIPGPGVVKEQLWAQPRGACGKDSATMRRSAIVTQRVRKSRSPHGRQLGRFHGGSGHAQGD
jgi:hypothetical protein